MESPPDKGDLGGWVFHQRNLTRFFAQSRKQESSQINILIKTQPSLSIINFQFTNHSPPQTYFSLDYFTIEHKIVEWIGRIDKRIGAVSAALPKLLSQERSILEFLHSLESRNPVKHTNRQGITMLSAVKKTIQVPKPCDLLITLNRGRQNERSRL